MDLAVVILVGLVIFVGLAGIVIPGLPGAGLMFLGMLGYAWYFGWGTIGWPILVTLALLAGLTMLLDYLAGAYGAKKYGGSKFAAWGSLVGGFVGLVLLNVPGLLLGLFLGAMVGELLYTKKDLDASLQVGKGAVLGFLWGTGAKLLIGFIMVGLFLWKIWA